MSPVVSLLGHLDRPPMLTYDPGNKPPWTLPAKAAYLKYDGKRAQRYFGESYEVPSFFPILSLLVFPLLHHLSVY